MPAVIKIRVCSARNLPVMDRTTELTDAYITLQFADAPQLRTHVARRTLNPLWNREFRIEVADDNELQDHPLQIRCWDKDIMSSDDEIGAVTVDLNPLLLQPTQLSGWYPLYDTLRGFCGELSLVIKMDFIGDVNPFKESGAGVQFFSLAAPPAGMRLASVQGLVEELISAPDPEHHWVDSFRTARLSNERRQLLLAELSGKLRRQMGSKVLEAGGNAVLSFCITLDLEGEQSGAIVARGLGTSVKLRPAASASTLEPPLSPDPYLSSAAAAAAAVPPSAASPSSTISRQSSCTWRQHLWGGVPPPITAPANVAALAAAATAAALPPLPPPALRVDSRPHLSAGSGGGQSSPLHLRSSPQPRMPSLPSPPSSWPSAGLEARGKPPAAEGDKERGEGGGSSRRTGRQRSRAVSGVALLTMGSFPQHVPVRIGGVVSARSVKLLLSSSQAAQVARDGWWSDLRGEIRAHARSLSCSAVIGYRESVSFHDELAILSASGTAVRMHLPDDFSRRRRPPPTVCTLGHTPYAPTEPPFPTRMQPCGLCGRKHVPELLLATVDRPPWLPALGEPCVIQARVCRQKKRQQGEAHAAAVSQALPFLEYDLHRQLQYKLQIQGKNALFGLRVTVDVGETLLLAVAEATGLCLPLLPPARPLSIRRNIDVLDDEDRYLVHLQRQIEAASLASAAAHAPPPSPHANGGGMQPAGAMLPQDRATQAGHERRVRSPPGTPSGDKASGGRGPADGRFGERASRESRSSSSEDEADGRYTGGWRGDGADGLGSKPAFVVDVDDEMDEDMMAVLLDPPLPGDPTLLASEAELADAIAPLEMRGIAPERATLLSLVRRVRLDVANVAPNQLNQQFSRAIHELDAALAIKVRRLGPSLVYKATTKVAQPEEHEVELQLTAHALRYAPPAEADMPAKVAHSGEAAPVAEPEERDAGAKPTEAPPQERPAEAADPVSLAPPPARVSVEKEAACEVAPESGAQPLAAVEVPPPAAAPPVPVGAAAAAAAAATTSSTRSSSSNVSGGVVGHGASASGGGRQSGDEVVLVPLSFVPGCATVGVLGPLSLHLIKETWSLREEGGVGNFCHAFVAEAQELARAHIGARGGNAALHFAAELNLTVHEPKKDHAYALIHCHADAALVRSLAEYRTWPSGAQS